jgi:hypothetical protein
VSYWTVAVQVPATQALPGKRDVVDEIFAVELGDRSALDALRDFFGGVVRRGALLVDERVGRRLRRGGQGAGGSG